MAKVSVNESSGDFTHVVKLDYVDLVAIGTGNNRSIGTLPAGSGLDICGVLKTVEIVGTSSLVFNIGTTSGDPDEFIDALDVDGMTLNLPVFNTGDTMLQSATTTTILGGSRPIKLVSADTPIYLKVTDAALASMTAGEVVIGMRIIDLGRFA
jgi:hypothetical protein